MKRDLIIGAASFGISELTRIMGKNILRGWFNKTSKSTTKEASKQLQQLLKGKDIIRINLKPNAKKIVNMTKLYNCFVLLGEKGTGVLYSYTTTMFHSTIINW